MEKLEKPKKPIEPNHKDYPAPKEPNGKNYLGQPLFLKTEYYDAYKKWQNDMVKYEKDLELYEQTKLTRLIKNADIKFILKKYKIIKRT